MIGDITQKTGSKAKAFTKKNAKGGSFKLIDKPTGDSGSDAEVDKPAKRAVKGMKNGPGKKNPGKDTPAPFMEKAGPGKRSGYKTMADDSASDGGGAKALSRAACNAWCEGKRGSYK